MRVAIIGLRSITAYGLAFILPPNTTEIVIERANMVSHFARECIAANGIKLTEFPADYMRHGLSAPRKRNISIVEHSDIVLASWDGKSRGMKLVIDKCKELGIPYRIYEKFHFYS